MISISGCLFRNLPLGNYPDVFDVSYIFSLQYIIRYEGTGKVLSLIERMNKIEREVTELETHYLKGRMIGRLPGYGFFLRHIEVISLDDIHFTCDEEGIRPPIMCDEVVRLRLEKVSAQISGKTPEFIKLENVREAVIKDSTATKNNAKSFLNVKGNASRKIILYGDPMQSHLPEINYESEELIERVKIINLRD